jgi:hypothetical protein
MNTESAELQYLLKAISKLPANTPKRVFETIHGMIEYRKGLIKQKFEIL